MAAFRILSFDGGGIMGAFAAGALVALDEECREATGGQPLAAQFDLITGTSIGGITALGLGFGATPDDLMTLYRRKGDRIFPGASGLQNWLPGFFRNLLGPKFSPGELRGAIEGVVRDQTMAQARTRLAIPAYDATMGRVYIFKTPHTQPGVAHHGKVKAVDVGLATSAAPTYFPAHNVPDHGAFVDGGVWGNCPAMVGIVEAVEFCKQQLQNIHVLSISTTNYPFRLGPKQQKGGLVGWGPRIIETFMFGQAQNAVAQATCLLRDRFHRIDYNTEPGLYAMDDAKAVEELIALGRQVAGSRENRAAFRRLFIRGADEPPTWPPRAT